MQRYAILEEYKNPNNSINTYEDFGLILGKVENPLPTIKTSYIDNPGGDGTIDNTEILDEIKYNDRTIKMPFTMVERFNDIDLAISRIANFIHGKKFKITLYKNLNYFYIGRLSIDDFTINQATGTFTLNATCKPYKYKKNPTKIIHTINGSKTITLENERKKVMPRITIDSAMTIIFEGNEYSISEGTHEILNIYLKEGLNEMTIKGNGTFEIEYQEASL